MIIIPSSLTAACPIGFTYTRGKMEAVLKIRPVPPEHTTIEQCASWCYHLEEDSCREFTEGNYNFCYCVGFAFDLTKPKNISSRSSVSSFRPCKFFVKTNIYQKAYSFRYRNHIHCVNGKYFETSSFTNVYFIIGKHKESTFFQTSKRNLN